MPTYLGNPSLPLQEAKFFNKNIFIHILDEFKKFGTEFDLKIK